MRDEKRRLMHQFLERGEREGDVFVDVDNVALFMLCSNELLGNRKYEY